MNRTQEVSQEALVDILKSDSKEDFAVPSEIMDINFSGENCEETEMHFAVPEYGVMHLPMTDYATNRLHGNLANGFKSYADHLRSKNMENLYSQNIRCLLRDKQSTFRVRTLANSQSERKVRAVVSNRFKPIDDDIIFGTALPLIDNQRFKSLGGNKTDTRTVAKFIERAPSVSITSGSTNRQFHMGFILKNSEVGAGSAEFSMFMSDHFCMNGCIFSKHVLANISYRHIGPKIEIHHGLIAESRATQIEMQSLKALIHEATLSAMSLEGHDKIVRALHEADQRKLEREDVPEFFVDLGKEIGLTKKEASRLPVYFNANEMSQLGVQAAVTRLAQEQDYERRLQLETIGGSILMMDDRKWNLLAA